MKVKFAVVSGLAVLALAGCGSSAPVAVKPAMPTNTATSVPAVPAAAAKPAVERVLREAVQAYSDAYLTGDGAVAYGLLSARCQKVDTPESFSALVSQAKTLYGNPLPMTSFTARIADGMARVTYTYRVSGINQADQPWTLEATGWKNDNC